MHTQPNNISTAQNPVGRFMVAVGAVIELSSTGKILLVQRSSSLDWRAGEWEIDYGRIDQHEDPETGLRREVSEEVGIQDLEIGRILRVWHIYRGPVAVENDLIGVTYYCQTHTETVRLSQEHQAYQWVLPEEALKIVTTEGICADIQAFINIQ